MGEVVGTNEHSVIELAENGATSARGPESPWRSSFRQLRRNKAAMGAFVLLVFIVTACLLAPIYAHHLAHENPFTSNLNGTIRLGNKTVNVLQANTQGLGLGVTPIGPTWHFSTYFLGADSQGRDVFARLLYGGRTSLLIGFISAVICCVIAAVLGLASGYFGGAVDWLISRLFDIVWAFPIYLLAISLSVVLLTSGLNIAFIHIQAGSLVLPILIIAAVFVPYVGRPIRGLVMSLKEREFIQAAIGAGASDFHILRKEILPNVMPSIIVFFPLMVAFNMLTESALSFLSIGVQPPAASWGTIINDGLDLLYTRPWVAMAPGIMIVITAGALNVLGDGFRDAFDPKAKLRGSI
ncbi:MAG TPA: ABC transporter permease [Acidimicrobiales bacterium]|nr:ABC transporter permease [Acidimicrobiales bacterium]